jgi:transcriptional regulator of arginine metabolism
MKVRRQSAILRLVRKERIESQEALRAALAAEGFEVGQATLSRDLRDIGLAKLVHPDGGSYYARLGEGPVRPGLGQVVSALLLKIEATGPLIVIRTATGGAPAIAAALDQAGWTEIIGTLAGDDTLLVITRNTHGRRAVEARLAALAR